MQVIATAVGFFGRVRQIGEQFEVPDDTKKATWFTPVDEPKPGKPGKQDKGGKPEPDADPI